jgi:hypothetical protein
MGRLTNLNPAAPIADADLPASIARDAEFMAADAAHANAHDPHSQYLNFLRGDARYEYRAISASKSLVGPINFPSNTWTSFGTIPGFSLGTQGEAPAVLVKICFLFDLRYPWQQAGCVGLFSPVWWLPVVTNDLGVRVFLENHYQSGGYLNIRASQGNGTSTPNQNSGAGRFIEINPEMSINISSLGRVDLTLKKE